MAWSHSHSISLPISISPNSKYLSYTGFTYWTNFRFENFCSNWNGVRVRERERKSEKMRLQLHRKFSFENHRLKQNWRQHKKSIETKYGWDSSLSPLLLSCHRHAFVRFQLSPLWDPYSMVRCRRFLLHRDNFVVHIIHRFFASFCRCHKLLIRYWHFLCCIHISLLNGKSPHHHCEISIEQPPIQWICVLGKYIFILRLGQGSFVQWLINFGLSFVHYPLAHYSFLYTKRFWMIILLLAPFLFDFIQLILLEFHNKLIHPMKSSRVQILFKIHVFSRYSTIHIRRSWWARSILFIEFSHKISLTIHTLNSRRPRRPIFFVIENVCN